MSRIRIDVDRVVVRADLDRPRAEALGRTLRDAFEELGRRLAKSPFAREGAREGALVERVLERLATEPLAADELLGARGAERLADELYVRLLEDLR